jgi:7-cyano-7-deazaguanine synthase in queuosine biosynthesis
MDKLCVISMSGGLDSSTLAFKAIEDGFTILPININYGQKNAVEQHSFENIYK